MLFIRHHRRFTAPTIALLAALTGAGNAQADDTPDPPTSGYWRVAASPFTYHYRYSEEHRPVWALAVERQQPESGWLVGASVFRNSFGQPSTYLYGGRRYEGVFGVAPLFTQWSAGMLYGYVGKYKTKVPLNIGGYSPGVLLSAGWQVDRHLSMQLNLLGDAAVMFQISHAWR